MDRKKFYRKPSTSSKQESVLVNVLNTPYLVIVESPSKCAKIEKYLGFQYKCIASKGHLREIAKVHPAKKNYQIDFKLIKEKESHAQWMKTIVAQFDKKHIFLGTDDDREGEAIAWHICEICGLDVETTKRILFHEVTESALKQAIANPLIIRMNIVKAQHARQILDRMIGFQISPILSRLLSHDNSKFLSAGRCQTPTLRLVYDRYQEYLHSKESIQYKVQATFFQHPSILEATLDKKFANEKEVYPFLETSKAFPHTLISYDKKDRQNAAPKPFSTSHLLQTASSLLHMSPKYVMDTCQKLYQDGKITYMRTESTKYAIAFVDQLKKSVEEKFGLNYLGNCLEKITNQDNKNPHEAIRVTQLNVSKTDYADKKTNDLYALIWRRCYESAMKPYLYEDHEFRISAPDKCVYTSALQMGIELGWKRVSTTVESLRESQQMLSTKIEYYKNFREKTISFQKIHAQLFMKDCEKYFQEAGIIQKLEHLGIGRPSTYSMLVDTIQERKYVLKQDIEGEIVHGKEFTLEKNQEILSKTIEKTFGASKNKIKIQELGIQAIDILLKYFGPLFDYSYTKNMEDELDEFILNDKKDLTELCKRCEDTIKQYTKPLQDKMTIQHPIDDHHCLVFGKAGAMIKCDDGMNDPSFKSIKSNFQIDLEKLSQQKYSLEELVELPEDCLGNYENEALYLKNGPYGPYVVWGSSKLSLTSQLKGKNLKEVTLDMVVGFIEKSNEKKQASSGILREITPYMSVRKGSYGKYIFYKTESMKKPQFINLKKCPYDPLEESPGVLSKWMQETLMK